MSFKQMCDINVNDKTEKKNGLTYLSWAWAEFVKVYPDATYQIEKDANGLAYFGTKEHGYMAYTSVTANGLTHTMWLPVMDHRNKSILVPTSFDVNKTIMRCLTKNFAMFGLGLYIYAGEDLPETEADELASRKIDNTKKLSKAEPQSAYVKPVFITPDQCIEVNDIFTEHGWDLKKAMKERWKIATLGEMTIEMYQAVLKAIAK